LINAVLVICVIDERIIANAFIDKRRVLPVRGWVERLALPLQFR
jgi:hypothetical protein